MKLLSISNCPLVESQGSGYIITGFCSRLRERGHEVTLIGPSSFSIGAFLGHRARSHRLALGMPLLLWSEIRSHRRRPYDVIEFYGGESWLAASLARLLRPWLCRRGKRFLLVSHSNGIETHHSEILRRELGTTSPDGSPRHWYHINFTTLQRLAFSRVDGVVTVSRHDAEYALQHGLQKPARLTAIENPLPEAFLDLELLEVDLEREPIIGFVGSWTAHKSNALMARDLSQVLLRFPDARLHLVGVGESFRARDHFPQEMCARVQVTPFVSDRAELREIYRTFSICVLASVYESFGLVAAEAMACGCALVASRTGLAASLRHGKEAQILQSTCSPHLQEAVEALLGDDALRRRIARNGHALAQSLRWASAVETLESTYERWLEEVRGR